MILSRPAVEIQKLNKKMNGNHIIKDLNFAIYSGEVFGFLGPNGAGKTTTIRMIVGLISMTSGDVIIQGKSIKTNFKEAVTQVGAIVENPEMYPFMTGMQNLMHFARMIPGVTKERINEIISLVGLEKAIHEKVGRYSLGMRQRIGIAQALLHRPSVLILDEPTNGLDPAGIREIRHYIRRLAAEQDVSVIISSHLLSEIELMCDRIGVIKKGELVAIQTVADIEDDEDKVSLVQIEVKLVNEAIEVIKSDYGIDAVLSHGLVTFESQKNIIPEIIQTLVTNEISIYQVGLSKVTLEDKFFDLIGENIIE